MYFCSTHAEVSIEVAKDYKIRVVNEKLEQGILELVEKARFRWTTVASSSLSVLDWISTMRNSGLPQ